MRQASIRLRKEHFVAALGVLNTKLQAENPRLSFYCIGGGALMLAYGARTSTEDLDASLSPTDPDTVGRFEVLKSEVAVELYFPTNGSTCRRLALCVNKASG